MAITTPEGLPVKTVKATLYKLLETKDQYISDKQVSPDVWKYDGMAVIHSLKLDGIITYEQLDANIFSIITHAASSNGEMTGSLTHILKYQYKMSSVTKET